MRPVRDPELDPFLTLALAESLERCLAYGDPTRNIGAVGSEDEERTTLIGLCSLCLYLVRGSPAAKPPYFRVLA